MAQRRRPILQGTQNFGHLRCCVRFTILLRPVGKGAPIWLAHQSFFAPESADDRVHRGVGDGSLLGQYFSNLAGRQPTSPIPQDLHHCRFEFTHGQSSHARLLRSLAIQTTDPNPLPFRRTYWLARRVDRGITAELLHRAGHASPAAALSYQQRYGEGPGSIFGDCSGPHLIFERRYVVVARTPTQVFRDRTVVSSKCPVTFIQGGRSL